MASDGTRKEANRGHTQGRPGRSDAWSFGDAIGREAKGFYKTHPPLHPESSGQRYRSSGLEEASVWYSGVGSLPKMEARKRRHMSID